MLHHEDDHHSRRWRWALGLAAAVVLIWVSFELRSMHQRLRFLEDQAETLLWRLGHDQTQDIPRRVPDGRDP